MQKVTLALTLFIIMLSGCSVRTSKDTKQSKEELKLDDKTQKYLNKSNNSMEMENTFILKEYNSSDYILPQSNKKLITVDQLDELEKVELDYARNEIYARHGYVFKGSKYTKYFIGKSWYKVNKDFSEADFNYYEKENLKLINDYVDSLKKLMTEVSNNYIDYDLNNDKNKDKITLVFMENNTKCKLSINGSSLSQRGTNFKNTMFIYNIDETDRFSEVAVVDEIKKGIYETNFYRYDGNHIIHMGAVSGDEETIKITGKGKVITKESSKILTDFKYIVFYHLDGIYLKKYVAGIFYEIKVKLFLKKDILLLSSKDENASTFTMKKGNEINLLKSDELEWVFIRNSEGKGGWIKLTKPDILNGEKVLDVFQMY